MAQEKTSNRRVTTTAPSRNTKIDKLKKPENDEPDFYKCPSCGKHYKKLDTNFPASQSELYAGWDYHLPICRHCLDLMFNHYTLAYGNDEDAAIRRICEKFDIYYCESLLNASRKITKDRSRIHTYISKANLIQYKGKTYDTTLDEERYDGVIESREQVKENNISVSASAVDRWGVGFTEMDYKNLDEHWKMLKKQNPNADSNQDIFIRDLCNINMLKIRALQNGDSKEYANLVEQYAKTFKQAGLRTIEEKDASNDETFCMTLGFISDYTPEEFYQDKSLYADWDNIGEYIERHITRPMINLETGSDIRDKEFYVPEEEDYEEE